MLFFGRWYFEAFPCLTKDHSFILGLWIRPGSRGLRRFTLGLGFFALTLGHLPGTQEDLETEVVSLSPFRLLRADRSATKRIASQ